MDLTAADVIYTEAGYPKRHLEGMPPLYKNQVTVSFGDGAKQYPATGVPLTGTKLGFPSGIVEEVLIVDATGVDDNQTSWTYDIVHNSLRGFDISDGGTEITPGATVDPTTLKLATTGY